MLTGIKKCALQFSAASGAQKGEDAIGIKSNKSGVAAFGASDRERHLSHNFPVGDFQSRAAGVLPQSRMRQRQKDFLGVKLHRLAARNISQPARQPVWFRPGATPITRNFVIDMRTAPATELDRGIKQPDDLFLILKQDGVSERLVWKPRFDGAFTRIDCDLRWFPARAARHRMADQNPAIARPFLAACIPRDEQRTVIELDE